MEASGAAWYTKLMYNSYDYGYGQSMLYFALIAVMIVSMIAQGRVQRTFRKYSSQRAACNKAAAQVASELLDRYGTAYVAVEPVQGSLTDHFNPQTNTVGLSAEVYDQPSVAALAVAAHEIGHVLQYQEGYAPIRMRNAVLPAANIGSTIAPWLVIAGVLIGFSGLAMAGAILFGAVLLFQLVTLPVEFNASSRALRMLEEGGYLQYDESDAARKVLRAAAMTYVWATVAALISFLRLFMIASNARRRD